MPKMPMSQWNWFRSATPAKIMMARRISAERIPQKSTRCCRAGGIFIAEKMRMKTNMLSIESDCSMR